MSQPDFKVLIAGAGIAGTCLAYWLTRAQSNISIIVIERSPVPRLTGQSIDLHDLSIEIIKEMGLEPAIRARGTTEEGTVVLNRSGKPVATFLAGDAFTAEYEILRADLAELLANATANNPKVHYRYGLSIDSLEQDMASVHVKLSDGSRDTFDLLVGADGSTSRTRPMILDEQTLQNSYHFLGQYIAFFSVPSQPDDSKMWYWYNTPEGRSAMLRPHRNSLTTGAYLCLTTPAHGQKDEAVERALDKGSDAMRKILRERFQTQGWQCTRILHGMDTADDFYMARIAQVKLPKWTNHRAVVLGDAAWATFGVGTSLAIEGAYFLAGEISKISDARDVPAALESYERTFRGHYANYEDMPPMFPQIAFPQTAWALKLRDVALWIVSRSRVYKLLQGGSGKKHKLPIYNWCDAGKAVSSNGLDVDVKD